ncbi:hypothetical protein MAPG_10499 [Magnaporthiopsis poae ATCC 64411]|uniref:DUF7357 domain-containing protein n=1 Tax=Magnaporthiopsis poae (strain ATCC 64411 / 73-15) TaxID=644358 RepID=A0A0C4ECR6_MAGP6|nr:hypothetical protein MAPG_10499 [Magnaporthiopsis poae ATCC 64411]
MTCDPAKHQARSEFESRARQSEGYEHQGSLDLKRDTNPARETASRKTRRRPPPFSSRTKRLISDLEKRTVSGRCQIGQDGKHLIDGPPLRQPRGRPAIQIPPRKRRRLLAQDPASPAADGGQDFSLYGSRRPACREASAAAHEVPV